VPYPIFPSLRRSPRPSFFGDVRKNFVHRFAEEGTGEVSLHCEIILRTVQRIIARTGDRKSSFLLPAPEIGRGKRPSATRALSMKERALAASHLPFPRLGESVSPSLLPVEIGEREQSGNLIRRTKKASKRLSLMTRRRRRLARCRLMPRFLRSGVPSHHPSPLRRRRPLLNYSP